MVRWLSPDTAPRDGRPVRLANPTTGNVEARFDGKDWEVKDWIYPGSIHYPHLYAWAPADAELLELPDFVAGEDGRYKAVIAPDDAPEEKRDTTP